MKLWKFDDCDYFAANRLDEALEAFVDMCGHKPEEIQEVQMGGMMINIAEEGEKPQMIPVEEHLEDLIQAGNMPPIWLGVDPNYA